MKPNRLHYAFVLLGSLIWTSWTDAEDWPQFLGPARNGSLVGTAEPLSFPSTGPPVIWEKSVGQGFSGPVVAKGRLILFHRIGDSELVECLDAKTGRPIWRFEYRTSYRDDFGFDEGPRSTPTITGGRVYTFGAEGVLHCLDFESGKRLWRVDTQQQFDVAKGFFGAACSPLVDGNALYLNIGGTKPSGLVAFDKDSGKVLWTATQDEASYSSPVAATVSGVRYLLFFTRRGLVGADGRGQVRFDFPWRARMRASVNAAVPLVIGDKIFISASYQTGAALLQIIDGQLKKLWSSDEILSNHYATSVYYRNYLYGFHGRQEQSPSLRCVELNTGKLMWSVEKFGAGTVTLVGDQLIVMKENGEIALALASPREFKPASTAKLLPGIVRAYPALDQGLLYARNENKLICVSLRK